MSGGSALGELEALLARSRSPGTFVERRRFTLSRARAVEKLREFTLRDPHQYVLELIQAAVFAGAESVAVDVGAGGLLLAYVGGRPLTPEQAAGIFDYLFVDRVDPAVRHLTQLAVGLNAVLQRRPRWVRIESGDGTAEGTLRVELAAGGRGVMGAAAAPIRGTYLDIRFGPGALRRLVGGGLPPEQMLIEERCLYTPIPILLNGGAPFGYFADRGLSLLSVRDQIFFDTGGRRGVIGVPIGTDRHRFRIVIGGVWVTTLDLPELGSVPSSDWDIGSFREPFIGVLCDDGLKKTADQSGVVRDRRFGALLGAVRPIADQLAERLGRRRGAGARRRERAEGALRMLGVRGSISQDQLSALPRATPLFRVDPPLAAWLTGPADPLRFPHRVLVLDALMAVPALEGRAVHRLESPEAIDFFRRVLDDEQGTQALERRCTLETPVPMDGLLTLRLHRSGRAPGWGPPGPGVPALVVHEGRSEWSGALEVALPALTVVFRADALARVPGHALIRALSARVIRHVPALISASPDSPGERALALAILAQAVRPRRLDGRLYAALDGRWAGAGRLLELPLLPGGISPSAWLEDPARPPLPEALAGWLGGDPGAPSEEELLAGLADPRQAGWLYRVPVSMPGVSGWLGLAEPWDPAERVLLVPDSGAPRVLALPCRGRLVLAGRGELSQPRMDRLRLSISELHAGAGQGALAGRYRARYARWLAAQDRARERPAALAELSRRLESALLDAPGSRVLRLALEPTDGPAVEVDAQASEGGVLRLRLSTRHSLVRAAQRPGAARELVLLECLRVICGWLDERGTPVDFLEAQQTLAAQGPGAPGAPPPPDPVD